MQEEKQARLAQQNPNRGGAALKEALGAFAVPYACCAAIVLCVVAQNHAEGSLGGIWALFSGGALYTALWLAFAASFACAAFLRRHKQHAIVAAGLYALCAALAAGFYASARLWGDAAAFSAVRDAARLLIAACLMGAVALLGRGGAQEQARFVVRAALRLVLGAAAATLLFFGCVFLAFAAQTLLFSNGNTMTFAADAAAVLYGLLLPLWLLPRLMPDAPNESFPRALRGFAVYGATLLLAALSLVFVLYSLQILTSGQWPSNQVAPMVLCASVVGFALLFFYGAIPDDPAARLFFCAFPIAWLFPLGMLFASTGIRIAAYGVTPARLLVAALGVWMLAALVYAFVCRKRFCAWVLPCSLELLLAACAICPGLNLHALSRYAQTRRLDAALAKADMGTHESVAACPQAPEDVKRTVLSAAAYLRENTNVVIAGENGAALDGTNALDVFGFWSGATALPEEPPADKTPVQTAQTITAGGDSVNTQDSVCAFFGLSARLGESSLYGSLQMEAVLTDWTLTIDDDRLCRTFDVEQAVRRAIRLEADGGQRWNEVELTQENLRVRLCFESVTYRPDEETGEPEPLSAVFSLVILE